MENPTPAPPPDPQVGGEGPVYLSCGALVVLALLPWLHFSFAGADFGQINAQMQQMFGSLGVSASAAGYDLWAGRIAMIAALVCAGLTLAERSGALRWERGNALLAAAGAAVVAAVSTLFAVLDFGSASQISLYLAAAAALAAAWFSIARLRELGLQRQAQAS